MNPIFFILFVFTLGCSNKIKVDDVNCGGLGKLSSKNSRVLNNEESIVRTNKDIVLGLTIREQFSSKSSQMGKLSLDAGVIDVSLR